MVGRRRFDCGGWGWGLILRFGGQRKRVRMRITVFEERRGRVGAIGWGGVWCLVFLGVSGAATELGEGG